MKNNIYIIGAGAIGKALAVSLKHAGKDVVLLRGRVDDKSNSRRKIQVVLNDGTELESEIAVSTINYFSELEGIIVLTNKSYANEDLSRRLKNRIKNSPVVVLQNGLGVEKVFVDHDFPEIYRCVLFVTSQNISQNKVRFKPVSVCPIGIIKGNQANLATIVTKLNSPHFRFRAEPEIQTLIWKKAIINCVFNSICPLLEIDNGV
ncbi:MAG TPA: 2-dehydropantoate 2-reductase N-terminal domain-containing protein, partial [Pyrinomonadaceae bacterium]|nr:2-dehydropantoate 2-reductase N-terminal domain-containing protein [Pyrinomonadaceae bacterium]